MHVDETKKIGMFTLLKHKQLIFAATSGCLAYFLYGVMEPTLASRLGELGMEQKEIGLFFIIFPVFYILSCFIV
jgi:hypothetical protein